MKKIAALLGLVGVVSLISACADSGLSADSGNEDQQGQISDNESGTGSSSSKKDPSKVNGNSSTSAAPGTVTKDSTIYLSSNSHYETPYMSNGVFCWSEKCEAAAATASSSSASIEVTISSEAQIMPIVSETQMTDLRDNKVYKLQTIAGTHWMAQNLDFATESGSFCSHGSSGDMCQIYGRYYSLNAAKRACPGGWRLPSLEEVKAADSAVDEEWWTLAGRFKYDGETTTEFGLDEQQGYWWLNNGASWRVQPDKDEHVEQSLGAADGRAYSVRCVEDK